jgi:hypothetical protein
MHHFRTTIVLALATLLSVSICSAQQAATTAIPNLIRYSGTLKDAQGAASVPSTTVGVTFAIYKQQDGGAPIWQETQNVTPDANGQYTTALGSTTATGLPGDLFSQQEQRWLGVQVQGQAEEPRVLLVSVPYAFKAHEAETLGGLPASAFMKAPPSDTSGGGATSAGNVTSVNALSSAGNAAGTRSSAKPKPLSQTSPFIPYWNGSAYTDSIMSQPNTSVINVNGTGSNGNFNLVNIARAYQIGSGNVLSIPGTFNLFVGAGAGSSNSSGIDNTFTGSQAGMANTTGHDNTFSGYDAGFGNTTGFQDSCYGASACLHNLTGIENVAVGVGAGFRNTSGSNNVYIGFDSGWGTTIANLGSNNTMTGWESGFNNSANNNVFYGYQAGYANTTAAGNSFVGYQSGMANTTGVNNTFIGYQAGLKNSTGFSNTFVGTSAGLNSTTSGSTGNTFVGTNAGFSANTVGSSSFFGYSAGSNSIAPSYGNTFSGYNSGRSNTTGIDNAIYGYNAGFNTSAATTGSNNTYLGVGAGSSVSGALTSGSNNTFVGFNAGNAETNVSNNIEIGNTGSNHYGSNQIVIGTQGTQTGTHIAGIYPTALTGTISEVCIDSFGKLGTINCPSGLSSRLVAAQQEVIKQQQQQIQTQGQQIADLQERLSRLESLIEKK